MNLRYIRTIIIIIIKNGQNRATIVLFSMYFQLACFFLPSSCLCSWLQQDVSCPACRQSLATDIGILRGPRDPTDPLMGDPLNEDGGDMQDDNHGEGETRGGLRNYFFYLDGQQIANWFPSFSIEVFHGRNDGPDHNMDHMVCMDFRIPLENHIY